MKIEITVTESDGWIRASAESDGAVLGESAAPVVDGATFDLRAAVIRDVVEHALQRDLYGICIACQCPLRPDGLCPACESKIAAGL